MAEGATLRPGPPEGRTDDLDVLRGLLDASPNVVFLMASDGEIRWVNAAVERLAGYTPVEILGTNILDHVDPDWDPYAFDSIGAALGAEGLRLPILFRIRRKDGSMVICEAIANAQMHDPVLSGLVVYLRRWDERTLVDQALETLAAGAPVRATLELLVAVLGCETLEAEGSIVRTATGSAEPAVHGTPALPEVLTGSQGDGPWTRAIETGDRQEVAVVDLPAELREAASARGFGICWVWPIPDHDSGTSRGCVVVWRRSEELVPDHTRVLALDRIVRIAELALDLERSVARLRHAATHDPLTGLANRARFDEALGSTPRGRSGSVALLSLDLDGFKPVNDELGHAAGDEVLVEIGRRLRAGARDDDVVARVGGDEFVVLSHGVGSADELERMAARLADLVVGRIVLATGVEVVVGASIGGCLAPSGTPGEVVLRTADAALYEAKAAGKGGWRLVELTADAHVHSPACGPP